MKLEIIFKNIFTHLLIVSQLSSNRFFMKVQSFYRCACNQLQMKISQPTFLFKKFIFFQELNPTIRDFLASNAPSAER